MQRMNNAIVRRAVTLAVFALALAHMAGQAHAQSSLGIGAAEPAITPSGPLAGTLQWINAHQQAFYRSLTGALKAMRADGSKLWLLVGLSFAYGVFHAAGPGHGKAVISSYMLANETALKRGILLSFAAAMLQGITAIVLMSIVFLALRGTAVSMTDAAWFLETASFALVAAFGAWLLWRKMRATFRPTTAAPVAPVVHSLSAASATESLHHGHVHEHHDHDHHHHHDHDHDHHHHHHHGHDHVHEHAPGEVCATCGHSHAPDPSRLSGDAWDWKTAWSAIAAVGIRPCSGALIVLTFAFLNALWLGGIVSVFAMALGTAITVSVLATLAVTAKRWAVAVAGGGTVSAYVHSAIEIAGALLILVLGLTLLAASLSA